MKRKIEEVLIKMGVPCGILGFKYITESILIMDSQEISVTDLYKEVAKKHNTTSVRVERAIRYCFKEVRNKTQLHFDYDLVDHYIGFINCENKYSLSLLHYRIKCEMESEEQ